MLSKSHNLNTSGGIASGPAAFPIFNEDFTFLSSSIVNRPSLISRSSKSRQVNCKTFFVVILIALNIRVKPLRENYSCNYKHQLKRLKNKLKLNK